MNKTIWIILAAVIIIGGGIALYANQNSGNQNQIKNDAMMENNESMMSNEEPMEKEAGENIMENKDSMTKDERR